MNLNSFIRTAFSADTRTYSRFSMAGAFHWVMRVSHCEGLTPATPIVRSCQQMLGHGINHPHPTIPRSR